MEAAEKESGEFRQIASHYQYTHNVNHCGNDNEIATTFYTDTEPVGRPLPAFSHPPRRGEGQGNPSWRLATAVTLISGSPLLVGEGLGVRFWASHG